MGAFLRLYGRYLYMVCMKVKHQSVLRRVHGGRQKCLKCLKVFVHGAIASERHVAHLNPAVRKECLQMG